MLKKIFLCSLGLALVACKSEASPTDAASKDISGNDASSDLGVDVSNDAVGRGQYGAELFFGALSEDG